MTDYTDEDYLDDDERDFRDEKELLAQAFEAEEYKLLCEVLDTFAGRRVVYNILSKCGIYDDLFSPCTAETNRVLGRRSVGLEVLKEVLTVNGEIDIIMRRENAQFVAQYTQLEDGKDG